MITFEDISEIVPDEQRPPLDREIPGIPIRHHYQSYWRDNGYIILNQFSDPNLIDAYCERYIRDHKSSAMPWRPDVPYMDIPEIRDLCLGEKLMAIIADLIGEEMAINLNLINWTSTERMMHQDDYLNPEYVNSHYLAVWFALDDIHPDSGPFEFVPGSHKWASIRRGKVWKAAPPEMRGQSNWNSYWPSLTEPFVEAALEDKIHREGGEIHKFIAKKGDILIWHGLLSHRGSRPNVRGMERRALISHYSGIAHRKDMPVVRQHNNQGRYFVL
jgi:Phytanoyl-CoA dioxygenase (PhyH)